MQMHVAMQSPTYYTPASQIVSEIKTIKKSVIITKKRAHAADHSSNAQKFL